MSWSDGGNQSNNHQPEPLLLLIPPPTRSRPIRFPPHLPPSGDGGGGGGCTLDKTGTGDALLPALFLVVLGLLLMRIKRRANKAGRTSGRSPTSSNKFREAAPLLRDNCDESRFLSEICRLGFCWPPQLFGDLAFLLLCSVGSFVPPRGPSCHGPFPFIRCPWSRYGR